MSPFPLDTQSFLLPSAVSVLSSPFRTRKTLVRAWISTASSLLLCSGPAPISWLSGKLTLALSPSPKKLIRCLRRCVTTQCFFGSSDTIFWKSCSTTGWAFHQPRFLWIEALLWRISSGQDVRWHLPYKGPRLLGTTGHPTPESISALSRGDGNQGAVCFQSHVALVWRAWCCTAVESLLEGRNHSEGMSSTARLWSLESQGVFFKNQDIQPYPLDRWAAGDLLYCLAFEPRESLLTSVALPGWPVALVVHLWAVCS